MRFPTEDLPMHEILVLYYSRQGSTAALARQVCRGVETVAGCRRGCAPWRRSRLPPSGSDPQVPDEGPPYATHDDLVQCCGLDPRQPDALRQHGGAAQISSWTAPVRCGFPAPSRTNRPAVFTSTQTLHGGQESTLLSMMLPLLHHGMYLVGLPYTERASPTPAAAARPTARAMWPALSGHGDAVRDRARTRARAWAPASPRSPLDCSAALERRAATARARDDLALGRGRIESCCAGYSPAIPGRSARSPCCALLAPLRGLVRGRRYTYAWATLFADSLSDFRRHRAPGESRRALGGRAEPAPGLRAGSALWFCICVLLERIANEGNGEAALRDERGLVELIENVEQRAQIARHALHQILECLGGELQAALRGAQPQRLARGPPRRARARGRRRTRRRASANPRAATRAGAAPRSPRISAGQRDSAASLNRRNSARSQSRSPATASTSSMHSTRGSSQTRAAPRAARAERVQREIGRSSARRPRIRPAANASCRSPRCPTATADRGPAPASAASNLRVRRPARNSRTRHCARSVTPSGELLHVSVGSPARRRGAAICASRSAAWP